MDTTENVMVFKDIERVVQENCNNLGRKVLKAVLEDWDANLGRNRDKKMYRHKGKKKTIIKTTIGEIEYERVVYEVWVESVKTGHVFLLDEVMENNGSGYFSELLVEQIIQACNEGSYRKAARAVSEATGQPISHTAIWNVMHAQGKLS